MTAPAATIGLSLEKFEALAGTGTVHGFVGRVPAVDVSADRAVALARLAEPHRLARMELGLGDRQFVTAEQVHGSGLAVVTPGQPIPDAAYAGKDGLVTNRTDVCLGIYVADCCAVFLVDPVRRAIGLVHAGKKGTGSGIVPAAIQHLHEHFGTQPGDLVVQLSPCIRPPWYEVDFAADITAQCRAAGVVRVVDQGTCTATHPDLYYSYRREKGKTGRMLALLALA